MNDTVTLEHSHIRDLLNKDNSNLNSINSFYQSALRIINSHLRDFYDHYAADTGLTVNQVETSASSWDIQQYQKAIDEIMNVPIANDQMSNQLQQAYLSSTSSKEGVMGAMLQAGLAVATAKVQRLGDVELPAQYLREFNYRSPQNISRGNIPTNATKNVDFNHRIWIHEHEMVRRTQSQLNKSLSRGLNGNSIERLTNTQPESSKRLNNNLSSQANSMVSRVQLVFKVHSIKNSEQGKNDAYKNFDTDYQYRKWITQRDSLVCPLCDSMDGNVYPANNAPQPQIDTHLGCRCQDANCDVNGDLAPVYP